MEITRKIRKDLLLLECYARPNNPRQGAKDRRGFFQLNCANNFALKTIFYKYL